MAQSITITLDINTLKTYAVSEIYKWGQVNKDDANYQRIYHIQYGDNSNLDRQLILDYVRSRARLIQDFVAEYLTNVVYNDNSCIPNDPHPQSQQQQHGAQDRATENVTYRLLLPGGWNGNTFTALQKHCNDYVVNGAVADWMGNIGLEQAKVFESRAVALERDITRNVYRKNSI